MTAAAPVAPRPTTEWMQAPARRLAIPRVWLIGLMAAAQVMFAIGATQLRVLGAVHALAVTAVAGYALLRRDQVLTLTVLAYIPGSDVLWRQSRAAIPYQWGFYLSLGICLFALVIIYGRTTGAGKIAIGVGLLLIPSSVITISTASADSREFLSFALSGPLVLAIGVAMLSNLRLAPWLYRRILWATLIGTLGPLGYAVGTIQEHLVNAGAIDFATSSNFVTSGNFGPVQVSSVLGLGVIVAILLVLAEPAFGARMIAFGAGVAVGIQSLLTFSRGGMISVGLAVAALALALSSDRRARRRIWAVVLVALSIGYFVVVPSLDSYTKGAFNDRFSDVQTGRTELAANDVETFLRNPMFGVGPGMTKFQRLGFDVCALRNDKCTDEASSHTEFTRLASEHGVAGIVALGLILWLAFTAALRRGSDRALAAALMVWAIAQMAYANLRISAVPIAFALAFVRVADPDVPVDEDGTPIDALEPEGSRR